MKIYSLLLSIEYSLCEVTFTSKFAPVDSSCCTHIFICMPIWLADIVSQMKKRKQRNQQQAIFTTELQSLISLFIFKGLSTISLHLLLWPLATIFSTCPLSISPKVDSLKMFGLPLWRFVFIRFFLPSNKFEDFAMIFFPEHL